MHCTEEDHTCSKETIAFIIIYSDVTTYEEVEHKKTVTLKKRIHYYEFYEACMLLHSSPFSIDAALLLSPRAQLLQGNLRILIASRTNKGSLFPQTRPWERWEALARGQSTVYTLPQLFRSRL